MYFETAAIHVNPWIPPLVAGAISFFTAMGGVSGAFLLLPFQMSFLGFTTPSVSATNQVFNIVAIPSGVYRYMREGRMVWPLTWAVVLGTLPGVFIGAVVRVRLLPDPMHFKPFAALVLLYIGLRMMWDLLRRSVATTERANAEKRFQELVARRCNQGTDADGACGTALPTVRVHAFKRNRIEYEFYGEHCAFPVWGVLALSFVVGIAGGIYGIGGGSIIAPFFVSFFHLPVYTVAGAALMGTFVTSVAGVIFYQVLAVYNPQVAVAPDWMLGALFGLGGMVGMYLGARCQKFVPARLIKAMLAAVILYTSLRYLAVLF